MKGWMRKALWIGAAAVLVSAASETALHSAVAREWLAARIRTQAQAALARDVAIGDARLQLFPAPAIRASKVTVANAVWGSGRHLAQASSIRARLALLPLLAGKVKIERLDIDGLDVNLETSPQGARNWDFKPHNDGPLDRSWLRKLHIDHAHIAYQRSSTDTSAWGLPAFHARAAAGWRNAKITASVIRDKHPMQVEAVLADLSRFGTKGAASDGFVHLQSGRAQLKATGTIPLEAGMQHASFDLRIEADSLTEAFGFFDIDHPPAAPVSVSARITERQGAVEASALKIGLGRLLINGDARLQREEAGPFVEAHLRMDRLDWAQALLDAGRPPLPPKPPGELFRTHALPWELLAAMHGVRGVFDVQIAALKLRSGIEATNVKTHAKLDGDQLEASPFSGNLLGGTALGHLQLAGHRKHAKLSLELDKVLLSRWLSEVGKDVPLTGGPMNITADISATGTSMKDLAASIDGPITIRMGATSIHSKKAAQAETVLTGLIPMLGARDTGGIELACVGARLPFHAGKAEAGRIVGMRSEASQLLTRGQVDLREQTLDLRGRVKGRSGLGLSALTGDVKITGRLVHPEVSLDPGAAGTLARIGAAILTSGASILGTTLWDGANPASDPCRQVFSNSK